MTTRRIYQPAPEHDFRGLDGGWLRRIATQDMTVAMVFIMLGMHALFGGLWLLGAGSWWTVPLWAVAGGCAVVTHGLLKEALGAMEEMERRTR